jgi:hypothetical protein
VAAGVGLSPLSDNSFLTHLATGRLIVDDWHIPRSDPYSFTANGEPWVVQSWLASLVYGLADEVGGLDAVRLVMGGLTVAIFAVVWRLTRPVASLVPRVAIVAIVVGVGAGEWSERPLLIGLVALALTVLAADGGLDPRWLLPVGWVWLNSHGSFPLGVAFLVVAALGRRLDGGGWEPEARALRWLGGGLLLGAVNPLGPRLLLFPLELLGRQDVLREVIEWQAPGFEEAGQRVFLLQVALAVLALARRPSLRSGLLLAVFLVAALLGARNVAVASLVLVPVLVAGAPSIGTLRSATRGGVSRVLAAVGGAALVLAVAASLGQPALELEAYPVALLDRLEEDGVDLDEVRLVTPDRVGNLLTLREGPGTAVFVDDRFDLFPETVLDDAVALAQGHPETLDVLDRWEADLVLVSAGSSTRAIVEQADAWRPFDDERGWVLFCRRGAVLSDGAGPC